MVKNIPVFNISIPTVLHSILQTLDEVAYVEGIKTRYRSNYFKARKWGSVLVHQIMPFFNAFYKNKDRQYIKDVWQGCHRWIQVENNKNAGLKFQAEQKKGLEGHGIKDNRKKISTKINAIAEVI